MEKKGFTKEGNTRIKSILKYIENGGKIYKVCQNNVVKEVTILEYRVGKEKPASVNVRFKGEYRWHFFDRMGEGTIHELGYFCGGCICFDHNLFTDIEKAKEKAIQCLSSDIEKKEKELQKIQSSILKMQSLREEYSTVNAQ